MVFSCLSAFLARVLSSLNFVLLFLVWRIVHNYLFQHISQDVMIHA